LWEDSMSSRRGFAGIVALDLCGAADRIVAIEPR
jgi:hypothetical protein